MSAGKTSLTYPFHKLAILGDVLQDRWPIYFLTISPSLFCLFILFSYLPSYLLYKRTHIQVLIRWLLWDFSLLFSQSVSFLNKVIFLASTPYFSDLLVCCAVSRVSLGSVILVLGASWIGQRVRWGNVWDAERYPAWGWQSSPLIHHRHDWSWEEWGFWKMTVRVFPFQPVDLVWFLASDLIS